MTLQNTPDLGRAQESWERRHAERIQVSLQVRADGAHGETCNVCSNGLYFETRDAVALDSKIEFSVLLPRGALAGTVQVICKGRIVRIDSRGSLRGVAVAVKSFRFEIKADDSSQPSSIPMPAFRLF